MHEEEVVLTIFAMMIFAGIAVLWMAMQSRRRFREMEHRERLAMIERGLLPSPESDPLAFEQSLAGSRTVATSPISGRMRSAGVILIGFGLALTVLITFAAETPRVAFGVGGAFVMIGLAFFVNASLVAQEALSYLPGCSRCVMREPLRRDSSSPVIHHRPHLRQTCRSAPERLTSGSWVPDVTPGVTCATHCRSRMRPPHSPSGASVEIH